MFKKQFMEPILETFAVTAAATLLHVDFGKWQALSTLMVMSKAVQLSAVLYALVAA